LDDIGFVESEFIGFNEGGYRVNVFKSERSARLLIGKRFLRVVEEMSCSYQTKSLNPNYVLL
jgi:hypothetical protein